LQVTQYSYNQDNTLSGITYTNCAVPTPAVSFTYDANYPRVTSMTDGIGTTTYAYNPINGSTALGAGKLASVTGPLVNEMINYNYDELQRQVLVGINGVASKVQYDPAGRPFAWTNALGSFTCAYDGSSRRPLTEVFPNGLVTSFSYLGNLGDHLLAAITNTVGSTPISAFAYGYDVPARRITS
jgi:hypothetical protein